MSTYKNGNYKVLITRDGSKLRVLPDGEDFFQPSFPESIDLKITDYCERNCSFCYESSSKEGKHADLSSLKFLDSLRPYTEVAIGGGNPLSHPSLLPFLANLQGRKVIANITVHQQDFMENFPFLKRLAQEQYVHGIGVSFHYLSDLFFSQMKEIPNTVLHVINGIDIEQWKKLYDRDLKVLLLGYKEIGRGKEYLKGFMGRAVRNSMNNMFLEIGLAAQHFKVLSFDNLAIEQLYMKRFFSEEEWVEKYMGDDGEFTFFVDAVKKEFGRNSLSQERFPLLPTIDEMFARVRK